MKYPIQLLAHIAKIRARTRISDRQLAQLLNIHRSTLYYLARRKPSRQPPPQTIPQSLYASRCPSCGYLTTSPCQICRTTRYKSSAQRNANTRPPPTQPPPIAPLALELNGESWTRYLDLQRKPRSPDARRQDECHIPIRRPSLQPQPPPPTTTPDP